MMIKIEKKGFCILVWLLSVLYSCNGGHPEEKPARLLMNHTEQTHINTIKEIEPDDTAAVDRQIAYADSLWRYDTPKAKLLLRNAADYSKSIAYDKGVAKAFYKIGYRYGFTATDSALRYYQLSLPYAKKLYPEGGWEGIYVYIAKAYYNENKTDSAIIWAYRAIEGLEKHAIKNYDNAFRVYRAVGAIWMNLNNPDAAMTYLSKAEQMALLLKDSTLLMDVTNTKGILYSGEKLWDSAIACYEAVITSPHSLMETKINANQNMGLLYLSRERKDRPAKSVPYFKEAIRLSEETYGKGGSAEQLVYRFELGVAYMAIGEKEGKPAYGKKGARILLAIERKKEKAILGRDLPNLYSNLAIFYGNHHQYKKAYDYSLKAIKMRDSLYNEEKLKMMGRLDVQYRVAEKDKRLAQNRLQILRQQSKLKEKNLLIYGSAFSALLLAAFLFSAYRSNKHKKQAHAKEMQLLQQQQEIKQLQAMMKGEEQERGRLAQELHDGVGGMLAAIKMNVSAVERTDNPPETTIGLQEVMHLVENTAGEVRRTAHNLMPDVLLKHHLPKALRLYCESINYSNHLQIDLQFHTPLEGLEKAFELPLYRILQELIQNIVKHSGAALAVIQFRQQDHLLHITVEDDGVGFDTTQQQEGLGLNNIRSRVQALQGMIAIDSSPGRGTTCYMEFDLQKYNNGVAL